MAVAVRAAARARRCHWVLLFWSAGPLAVPAVLLLLLIPAAAQRGLACTVSPAVAVVHAGQYGLAAPRADARAVTDHDGHGARWPPSTKIAGDLRHVAKRAAFSDRPAPPDPLSTCVPDMPRAVLFWIICHAKCGRERACDAAGQLVPAGFTLARGRGFARRCTCSDARSVCIPHALPTSSCLRRVDVYRASRVAS